MCSRVLWAQAFEKKNCSRKIKLNVKLVNWKVWLSYILDMEVQRIGFVLHEHKRMGNWFEFCEAILHMW